MNFIELFTKLTGYPPFPWQEALYEEWFSLGKIPQSCILPTGLGKTSVIAVWLIALSKFPDKMPKRLVYVVNRRTVVDQTTEEVEKYQRNRVAAGVREFEVSTLRGQFADNGRWCADPSKPAVICGTVDMIGSRLLFSGYGIGRGKRPLHAGFLGQDALLVHDEAHLEPAFQTLIDTIESEQKRERAGKPALLWPQLRVMELTATPRSGGEVFELTSEEKKPPTPVPAPPDSEEERKKAPPIHHVWWRTHSKKSLRLHKIDDEKRDLVPTIVKLAHEKADDSKPAVLVFVRTVEAVNEVVKGLKGKKVDETNILTLTGTMRGYERDRMADESEVFARFKKPMPLEERKATVYLVCTSAGEVGVDMSADHMVCDLSTLDSMAQRLGGVNRYGFGDAIIDVVSPNPKAFETKDKPFEAARERTLGLLKSLRERSTDVHDASPAALGEMIEKAIAEGMGHDGPKTDRTEALRKYILSAFAPTPTLLQTTDILFDAWALTTIREKLPGRPPVEPYLHGLPTEWQPPETQVAWREEVEKLTPTYATEDDRLEQQSNDRRRLAKRIPEWLDDYPLKPHELLRDNSKRVFDRLSKLKATASSVWVIDEENAATVTTLGELVEAGREAIEGRTVLLPPRAGGLTGGMLTTEDYKADRTDYDVADELRNADGDRMRLRVDDPLDPRVENMRLIRTVELPSESEADEDGPDLWHWYELPVEGGSTSKWPVLWHVHVRDVEGAAMRILGGLPLDANLKTVIEIAAKYHDHGKRRRNFQLVLGNRDFPKCTLAKSGKKGGKLPEKYRHEFGSLIDIRNADDFVALGEDERELVLHLIATHHGRARPHFPQDEAFDHEHPATVAADIACAVPRRYARLQRKYGRWGLAYLESLLRAADWAASGSPSEFWKGGE